MKYSRNINLDIAVEATEGDKVRTVEVARSDLENWLTQIEGFIADRNKSEEAYYELIAPMKKQLPSCVEIDDYLPENTLPYDLVEELKLYLWANKEDVLILELYDVSVIKAVIDKSVFSFDAQETLNNNKYQYEENIEAIKTIKEIYGANVDFCSILRNPRWYYNPEIMALHYTPIEFLERWKEKQEKCVLAKTNQRNLIKQIVLGSILAIIVITFCIML